MTEPEPTAPVSPALTEAMHSMPIDRRAHVRSSAAGLRDEFAGVFSRETIERFLAEALSAMSSARVKGFVPLLAERFARQRLEALARIEGVVRAERPSVLFLCVHNAGRSQMAAGWLRHLAGGDVDVYSGGSAPGSAINPLAVEAMAEVGIDIANEFPKPWTEEVVRAADVVVTMGCGDACPVFPGTRYEDWEVADPADRELELVRDVRDEIGRRVGGLIASLELPPGSSSSSGSSPSSGL